MLQLNAVCGTCRKSYGVHVGPMSSLKTKNLLETLAQIEDLHFACVPVAPQMRHLHSEHPLLAS